MAVAKVGHDQWQSSLTGQIYTSEQAAKHYEDLERMRSAPESEGDKILAGLSTEQVKSLVTAMSVIGNQATDRMDWQAAQQQFVDDHPEFLACETNGGALVAALSERGKLQGDAFTGTMADLEEVYYDLSERNVLLRKKGVPRPKRPFDAAEAFALPADELEKRARGW